VRRPCGTATAEQTVEQPASEIEMQPTENILEVDAAKQVLGSKSCYAGKSAGVVFGPFLWIGKNRVGLRDFLKAFFCARLFIAVRMVF
jgi:hypothetical protein